MINKNKRDFIASVVSDPSVMKKFKEVMQTRLAKKLNECMRKKERLPKDVNIMICKSLGIDPSMVQKVTITLEPKKFPTIEVIMLQTDNGTVHSLIEVFELCEKRKK